MKDKAAFATLTQEWLHDMQLQNDLVETRPFFLLGRWLSYVPPWAASRLKLDRLNYDARSILTTWGDRKTCEFGLHVAIARTLPLLHQQSPKAELES